MSVLTEIHTLLDEAKAKIAALFGHEHTVVADAVKKIDEVKASVEADAPALEHEAVADAEKVAADAETAAKPVVEEAVKAAETVASEAVADVAKSA